MALCRRKLNALNLFSKRSKNFLVVWQYIIELFLIIISLGLRYKSNLGTLKALRERLTNIEWSRRKRKCIYPGYGKFPRGARESTLSSCFPFRGGKPW
jgi:hypothetical protein